MTEDALKTFRITDGWEIGADAEVFFRKKGGSLGFTNNTLTKPIYALQFHPEVTHTEHGKTILDNYIFKVCKANADWKMDNLIEQRIQEIKNQVQDN